MSKKLDYIPFFKNYEEIREWMKDDLDYRLATRLNKTSLGRPLYERINVQLIMTQECPYHCDFCLERKHPMKGQFNAEAQKIALFHVLKEHPNARLSITGGEPSLYPDHVKDLVRIYNENSKNVFCSINTAGYDSAIKDLAHINLSINDYVQPDPKDYPHCTVQTVLTDEQMTLDNIMGYMRMTDAESFSFRYLCDIKEKHDYNVNILKELSHNPKIKIRTFRVGDFFMYVTFDYFGKHARITLGDMYQQTHNDYKDGYSNIIIHPNGKIGVNWH